MLKNFKHKLGKFLSIFLLLIILLRIYENNSIKFDSLTRKQIQNGLKYKKLSFNFFDFFLSNHANVKQVDMEDELEPKENIENFVCRSSKHIIVTTMLCVHSIRHLAKRINFVKFVRCLRNLVWILLFFVVCLFVCCCDCSCSTQHSQLTHNTYLLQQQKIKKQQLKICSVSIAPLNIAN